MKLDTKTKESDALAEAYTMVTDIARKAFYDTGIDGDTVQFLRSITSQINLYRVAIINRGKGLR